MRGVRRTALLTIALLSACATTSTMNFDPVFRDYAGNVPGASVIVIRDGRVVYRSAYGMANLEEHIPATPDTHYRLASVSKQFTAAAILSLAGRGRLSLDDPIRRWLPSLPPYADRITIRHLLTHTSGLIDYEDVIPAGRTKQLNDDDVLHLIESQTTTRFPPGTSWRYSNGGYVLLGLIVARASGESFPAYLHDAVFGPLGMDTTVMHVEGNDTVSSRAYGYSREGDRWTRTDQSITSATLGDGGIYTSVDQLARWVGALQSGKFGEESIPRVETDKKGEHYGFGWYVSEHDGQRMVWHTGESIGFHNAIVRFPDERLAIVVLTNRTDGDPYNLALRIADEIGTRR